jgi:hypothetical protein
VLLHMMVLLLLLLGWGAVAAVALEGVVQGQAAGTAAGLATQQ